jgi:hypothetical protein
MRRHHGMTRKTGPDRLKPVQGEQRDQDDQQDDQYETGANP